MATVSKETMDFIRQVREADVVKAKPKLKPVKELAAVPVPVRVVTPGLSAGVKVGIFLTMYGLYGFTGWIQTGTSPNITAIGPAALATGAILGVLWLIREFRGGNNK